MDNKLIPKSTILIPGEPANINAGAKGTIYHNKKYATTQDVWNAVKDQAYSLIGKPQYGGFFDWTINYDADSSYGFSKTVFSCFNNTKIGAFII
jgi:hypothetical protein